MNPSAVSTEPLEPQSPSSEKWREDPLRAMMLHDILNYLPGDILVKVDRASMWHSLETRIPFLDRDVAEFALSLQGSDHAKGETGKYLLKSVLGRYLPQNIIERPKMGFATPVSEWLRGPLKAWADDLLDRDRLRSQGILNHDVVSRDWEWHKSGALPRGQAIWGVLMFQAWYEEFLAN